MSTTPNFDHFSKAMADFASDYLTPAHEHFVAGNKLKRPTDSAFELIFRGYFEISESLELLDLGEKLLGTAPPRAKGIDKHKYLGFLISAYLQDIYILEQRLSAYATKISRLYKKPMLPEIIKSIVYEPLQKIISIRGAHVHSRRYTDEHLDAVGTFALFDRVGHELGQHLDGQYKIAQLYWKSLSKKNNTQIKQLVDQYFAELKPVLIIDDKVVFPPPKA